MRNILVILAVAGLIGLPSVVSSEPNLKATIDAPAEFLLHTVRTMPLSINVLTVDGEPYCGKVELYASLGEFQGTDDVEQSPVTVGVQKGKAHATIRWDGDTSLPVNLLVVHEQQGILAESVVEILIPDWISIAALQPSVPADGVSQPVVQITIKDQHRRPLAGVEVVASLSGTVKGKPAGKTDEDGVATILLPASERVGFAVCQGLGRRVVSPQVLVYYAETRPAMARARNVAAEAGVDLHWDSFSRTASATIPYQVLTGRGGESMTLVTRYVRLAVKEGEITARVNGQLIPMAAPARLVDGHLMVPESFLSRISARTMF